MRAPSIRDLYRTLIDSPSGHAYTAMPVAEWEGVYLGVDAVGRPALFVQTADRSSMAPLRTTQISLILGGEYHLALGDSGVKRELFHALLCEASSRPDIETFLVLIEAFLSRAAGRADVHQFTSFFRSMVRLFSVAPARDVEGERQGLWGELFVMSLVRGFAFWAPFWHSEPTRRFDFSAANKRIEVKTALSTERIHHFSHRQLFALDGEEIVVASLLLREEDAGLSLRQLIEQARQVLRPTGDYLRLERAIRQAGMESSTETGPIYDAREAEQALAWYRSVDAPHFRMAEPAGVSQTHYRVDLANAPQIPADQLAAWLDLWPAAAAAAAKSTARDGSLGDKRSE